MIAIKPKIVPKKAKLILNPLLNNKPVSKEILESTKISVEKATYNKKTYGKEYRELKFLVETKNADKFTIEMYVAMISGRKITDNMLYAIRKIMKRNTPNEVEKKRLETERLHYKVNLVKEALYKCNYDEYYESRSEDFLGSIIGQVRNRGSLSPKQKLALNKMFIRFNKRIKKDEKKA